jgi:hypothetical protein
VKVELPMEVKDTLVTVMGAGLVPWTVLRWLCAVQRVGVRLRVEGEVLSIHPTLPPVGQEFVDAHAADLRRVLLATPDRLM